MLFFESTIALATVITSIRLALRYWLKPGHQKSLRSVLKKNGIKLKTASTLTDDEFTRVKGFFSLPNYQTVDAAESANQLATTADGNIPFSRWLERNTELQKQAGYRSVTLSLKPAGVAPGDVTDKQLETIADLADRYSFGELRTTHNQNIVLTDVIESDLYSLWQQAKSAGLATPTIGTINDMICCPGDYCSLANAKSIPVAEAIHASFQTLTTSMISVISSSIYRAV